MMLLIRADFAKYANSSYNSVTKWSNPRTTKTKCAENLNGHFSKEDEGWPTGTWKGAQRPPTSSCSSASFWLRFSTHKNPPGLKWDLIKLTSCCTAKEIINKMKRWHTEWEKIFTNEVTENGLISKIYKQLMQFKIKKNKQPNQKMGGRST